MMQLPKKWLLAMLVTQALMLIALLGQGPTISTAKADGIPDAGAQRDQILEQMKATNQKLDRLISLLSGGDLRVKISKSDRDDANK